MFWVTYLRQNGRRICNGWRRAFSLLSLPLFFAVTNSAQLPKGIIQTSAAPSTNSAASQSQNPSRESVSEKLAKARIELEIENARVGEAPLYRGLLQRLVRLYEQELNSITELATLKARRAELAREAADWTGFADPKPYSIFLTDNLREGLQVEQLEITRGESALTTLRLLTEDHRAALKASEERIRILNEQLEKSTNADQRIREREIERARSRVSLASVETLDLERQIRSESLAGSRIRRSLLERKLAVANRDVIFTEADLQRARQIFQTEQDQAEQELKVKEAQRADAEKALNDAREQLRQTETQSQTNFTLISEARELADARRAELETIDLTIHVLRFILQADTLAQSIWEARFEAYRSQSLGTLRWTGTRLRQFQSRIALWKSYYNDQLEDASSRVTLQQERLKKMEPSSAVAASARQRLAALTERDQLLLRVIRHIQRGERLVERLEEELHEANGNLPFLARVRTVAADGGSLISRLWNFELFVAQDTIEVDGQQVTGKRSITLGKIASVILILVLGYWLTNVLSRFVEPVVARRFKIDANQANLIRRWVRVILLTTLALASLALVKIPFTVFAFAGGALAIALGFGMQTLLKNFVSGIIILFERPFRVGDVLDVAGFRGTVVGIGTRSSVLQLWDGTETLIPNSVLLENSVTNWTYSNPKVRFTVTVGVAYGSDTRRVIQLLTEVVERHGVVEKNPSPQIFLVDFGPSALNFEIRFWVNVVSANSSLVSSDLRQMIATTFAENKIIIAFPQQELHFDQSRPIPVQVVIPSDTPGNGKPATASAATEAAKRDSPPDLP